MTGEIIHMGGERLVVVSEAQMDTRERLKDGSMRGAEYMVVSVRPAPAEVEQEGE